MTSREKAIALARKIARERDLSICQKCGQTNLTVRINGSHIFPESFGNIAADPDNIIALCISCHKFARSAWHNSPLEVAEWFHDKWPGRYQKLKKLAYPIKTIKEDQWKSLLKRLKIDARAKL